MKYQVVSVLKKSLDYHGCLFEIDIQIIPQHYWKEGWIFSKSDLVGDFGIRWEIILCAQRISYVQ
jgi:hypothetical protein